MSGAVGDGGATLGVEAFRAMLRIRRFEERLLVLDQEDEVTGHFHIYVGQEATAVASLLPTDAGDVVYTTHRNHGHLLARGADPFRMFAEILGRRDGYCGGRGGSIHIAAAEVGVPHTSGSVGGSIPQAAGAAFALSRLRAGAIVVCFFGDGTFEEGAIFEAINTIAKWRLPILLVCENNGLDAPAAPGSFPTSATAAERLTDIPAAFTIPSISIDGIDVASQLRTFERLIAEIRGGGGPRFVETTTVRWPGSRPLWPELSGGSFQLDWLDGGAPEIVAEWTRDCDPLVRAGAGLDREALTLIDAEVTAEMAEAATRALASPWPDPAAALISTTDEGGPA
jgi:pyruvate dehydrogenase E1 component alpha subunit